MLRHNYLKLLIKKVAYPKCHFKAFGYLGLPAEVQETTGKSVVYFKIPLPPFNHHILSSTELLRQSFRLYCPKLVSVQQTSAEYPR